MLDLAKAFDSVPHHRLLLKLECLGISGNLLSWFNSFLTSRHQRVVVNGCFSEWLPVRSGVPQGSVLGPLLFVLYIDEIHQIVSNCTIKLFADDIALYKQIISADDQALLQDDLNKIYQWSLSWQLKLNPKKCESICISFKRSPPKCNYQLNGEPIPSKSVIRYLGIYINSCLKWSDHVKHISARATRSLNYLRHTLFSTTPFVKSAAYNCLIRPLLEYASPVWYLHSTKDIDKLEAIQRRAARWVCGSRWNPHTHNWTKSSASCLQNLNWPSLHTRRSYFAITQVHDILHKKVSIPFDSHFKFRDNNTRSHPLSLVASSSSINAYRYSFFINSPFLWNSIPFEILQIAKSVSFRLALRRFLFH